MHLAQHKLCTRKIELALEVKFYLDVHWVTRPWRRTLANGNDLKDVFPWSPCVLSVLPQICLNSELPLSALSASRLPFHPLLYGDPWLVLGELPSCLSTVWSQCTAGRARIGTRSHPILRAALYSGWSRPSTLETQIAHALLVAVFSLSTRTNGAITYSLLYDLLSLSLQILLSC